MAITLPLPLRVAAGVLATGIQLVRSLPEEIPALPVALVGNAMRLSMKVQQEIDALATRGDELLGGLIGGRPQESPGWATFDEDRKPATRTGPQSVRTPAPAKATPAPTAAASVPSKPAEPESGQPQPRPKPARSQPEPAGTKSAGAGHTLHEPGASSLPDPDTTAKEAAEEVGDALIELATHAGAHAGTDGQSATVPAAGAASADTTTTTDTTITDTTTTADSPAAAEAAPGVTATDSAAPEAGAPEAPADGAGSRPVAETPESDESDGPAVLPGYDAMTLAQVRGHLRELTVAEVTSLLSYEQSGDNRAPFLTLLSNRLVTLGAQES